MPGIDNCICTAGHPVAPIKRNHTVPIVCCPVLLRLINGPRREIYSLDWTFLEVNCLVSAQAAGITYSQS